MLKFYNFGFQKNISCLLANRNKQNSIPWVSRGTWVTFCPENEGMAPAGWAWLTRPWLCALFPIVLLIQRANEYLIFP